MAENKNKTHKNINSLDKLTLSLGSSQPKSRGSRPGNSKTEYTLSLDSKNGNLLLKIQTESSKKHNEAHHQPKPTYSGPTNSHNASKTHLNIKTGQNRSPHFSKNHISSKTGPKNAQHASITHTNSNIVPIKAQQACKINKNSNIKQKGTHHASKANQNFVHVSKSDINFKTDPKSPSQVFKSNPNLNLVQKGFSAFSAIPNILNKLKSPPAAFKVHPNMYNYSHYKSQEVVNIPFFGDQTKDSEPAESSLPPSSTKRRTRSASRPRHKASDNDPSCPTCLRTFSTQIYQCSSGHSACRTCKENQFPCGTCGQLITDIRNFSLEAFLAEKKVSCPHNIEGCKQVIKISEIDIHVKECPFGMPCRIKCPAGCSSEMSLKQLSAHFNEKHPAQRLTCVGSEIELRYIYELSKKMYLVKMNSYHFLFHEWVWPESQRIYMAAQLIGTKADASKWSYDVHIYNKSEPRRKYMFTEICTSFEEPLSEIFKEGKCCILTRNHAISFLNHAAINYKFFIKKMDENNYLTEPVRISQDDWVIV